MRSDVVLPQPEGPTKTVMRPVAHSSETSESPDLADRAEPKPTEPQVHGWGGYIVSHELNAETDTNPAISNDDALGHYPLTSFPALTPAATQSFDFEVITQPTFENASFPFAMPGSPLTGFFDPYSLMPSPKTYSGLEVTFGRRLQRHAVECGYALITSPNPDPEQFARVFGFCMVFESAEKIRARLKSSLDRTREESLNYWQFPFVNLGGAGTQFPELVGHDSASSSAHSDFNGQLPIGNQGTLDPLRPKFDTGFSTGPFSVPVTEARDKLGPHMRILMPGFEGNFYDCDEIEMYLRQRGVEIPAGADHVVAEVDMAAFNDPDVPPIVGSGGIQAPGGLFGPSSSDLAAIAGIHGLEMANAFAGSESMFGAGGGASSLTPSLGGGFVDSLNSTTVTTSAGTLDESLLAFAGLGAGSSKSASSPLSTQRLVTVDVNILVKGTELGLVIVVIKLLMGDTELVDRATCLGRTPGFRQTDVNAAFWIATRNSPLT